MTLLRRRSALGLSLAAMFALVQPSSPQARGGAEGSERPEDVRLPNGKLQRDEILKQEREENIKDAARLSELAGQLQQELEKLDYTVLSMSTLKKTEDIEKLARKIRTRLRHD